MAEGRELELKYAVADRVALEDLVSADVVFGSGERERFFIGSADVMERNLDRRVEAMAPVSDHDSQAKLRRIVEVMLADDRRAWLLGAEDRWTRVEEHNGRPGVLDTFETMMLLAQEWSIGGAPVPAEPA